MKDFFETPFPTLSAMVISFMPTIINNIIPICQLISILIGIIVGITYIILNIKKIRNGDKKNK